MALTMSPTGLSSPVDKDRADYTIFSGEWAMGRIYEQHGGAERLKFFWSLFGIFGKPADLRTDGHAPTLDSSRRLGGSASRGRSYARCKKSPAKRRG